MRRVGQILLASLGLVLAMLRAQAAQGQGPLRDGFETAETAWREVGSDVQVRFEVHQRTPREPHTGSACEFLQYSTVTNGSQINLAYNIGRAMVIPELAPSIWVRCDKPGIQLQARVVLPRARDPKSGEPLTTIVGGTTYNRANAWEQLRIGDLPTLLTRQVRVLRLQQRTDIDVGEAYIDRLLLNIYTGGGRTQLSIDDLEVAGFIGAPAPPASSNPATTQDSGGLNDPQVKRTVELNGSVLLADGRPYLPRLIEHRGEPLSFLRQVGFNGIIVENFPAPELLTEAATQRMWIVCPPPRPQGLDDPQATLTAATELETTRGIVLAWHLGTQLTGRDLEVTKRWSDYLRRFDRGSGRPLLAEAETDLRSYSRYVDTLVLRRQPLGTSFELNDYVTWLRERPKLARPGTPFWTVVQTQLAAELREQCAGLSNGRAATPSVGVEQIRLLAYHGLASGARGLLFASSTRLDAQDPLTRLRVTGLELLNYELMALEPWGASGNLVATTSVTTAQIMAPGALVQRNPNSKSRFIDNPAPPALPDVQVALLQTERARLLMPLWSGAGAQYVPGQLAASGASFVMPGIPEANDVYRLTPGGLPPARHNRVAGGIRVVLEEMSATSHLVMTQDPLVIGVLMRRMAESGPRMLQLQRELTAAELQRTVEIDAELTARGHPAALAQQHLTTAQRDLQSADAQASTRELAVAYEQARRVLRPLQLLQRVHWEAAAKTNGSPAAAPLAANYNTLPLHWDFVKQLGNLRIGPPLLPGGEFEDLNMTLRAGWQHFEHPQEGIQSRAELSDKTRDEKKSRASLHLAARSTTDKPIDGLLESPPLWITSPPVQAQAGAWLHISGFVYTRKPITCSLDGLMIIDSIGGEALAERIGEAQNWRPFTLYRFVPRSGPVTVTIALTGLGEAWLDDISISALLPPGVAPAAPVQEPVASPPRSAIMRLPQLR